MSKQELLSWIDENRKPFEDLADEIWEHPQIAHEETYAAERQMEMLRQHGFTVTQKGDIPTAFMAEWGKGAPVIGILGEYDALAGLSQKVSPQIDPVEPGAPGHGCGHNLLGVGGMLAACAAKAVFEAGKIGGTIRYYGCPAEEQLVGKSWMAKAGYFEGTDVSLAWHPGDYSSVGEAVFTALLSARFKFKGRTAHAGGYPEAGRSALDAVEIMNVGANYLREHMLDQDRIHYVITNGGLAPNIVPGDAEVWYYARAPHDAELVNLWKRLIKVARGAAMITETEVSWELIGGCYNTLPNKTLDGVLDKNLREFAGVPGFDEEDMAFARELQATLPEGQMASNLAKLPPLSGDELVLVSQALPIFDAGRTIMGSTDVGDVANLMPTSLAWGTAWPLGVPAHTWQSTASAGSPIGRKGMVMMAKALAGAMYDLSTDGGKAVTAAKKEFEEKRGGKPYRPIDELLKSAAL